jgi:hypothetical protein
LIRSDSLDIEIGLVKWMKKYNAIVIETSGLVDAISI